MTTKTGQQNKGQPNVQEGEGESASGWISFIDAFNLSVFQSAERRLRGELVLKPKVVGA